MLDAITILQDVCEPSQEHGETDLSLFSNKPDYTILGPSCIR